MYVLVSVCVVNEKCNWVWKRTTMLYGKMVMAGSLVSFWSSLAFLLVLSISVISKITSFLLLLSMFIDYDRRYRRVLRMTTTVIA